MEAKDIKLTKLAKCAGCGAKVGAGVLAKLLEGIRVHHDPNLLVGFDKSDDASVYKISDELALVQTVDFFPPIADDPYPVSYTHLHHSPDVIPYRRFKVKKGGEQHAAANWNHGAAQLFSGRNVPPFPSFHICFEIFPLIEGRFFIEQILLCIQERRFVC